MKCKYHSCQNEVVNYSNREKLFCSYPCKNKYCVEQRRWQLKLRAIDYLGGKCQRCGYNKLPHALEFHHRCPEEKEFQLSLPHTRSWEKMKIEVDKCDLLCSNCHKEVEFEKLVHKKEFFAEIFVKFGFVSQQETTELLPQ